MLLSSEATEYKVAKLQQAMKEKKERYEKELEEHPMNAWCHSVEDDPWATWSDLIPEKILETEGYEAKIIGSKSNVEKWSEEFFQIGFGCDESPPFIVWTENWIYFSHVYDGLVSIECLPRNPESSFEVEQHIGGQYG